MLRGLPSFPTRRSSDLIIEPAKLNKADIAIGDLPICYYPLPVEGFTTAFKEGKSFAHLLMLEADRKSTRLNSSHVSISYAVFCLKKNNKTTTVREVEVV